MSTTRVFNDFKRRLLNGEVPNSFNCKAYLLNSNYEKITETPEYMRNIIDFATLNYGALHVDSTTHQLAGSAIASGAIIENTYYRTSATSEEDVSQAMYSVVTSANVSAMSGILGIARNTRFEDTRFADYLKKYSYFYVVTRADEFAKLIKDCRENDYETFAVVLADDIEHVTINSTCFGVSREHPFRGVFDGNGYALHIASLNANSRSNGIFGYIAETGIVRNLKILSDEQSNSLANNTISIINNNKISLSTIKNGDGDVKIGVLAGVNNGTIENTLLSANIIHIGSCTPEFYFVQNKTSNENLLSNSWKKLNLLDQSNMFAASSLSSYSNFFYPTQLCLNSISNIIPYVGYFNEGCVNSATVEDSVVLQNALYTTSSTQFRNITAQGNYNNYMPDILNYQEQFNNATLTDDDHANSRWNLCLLGSTGHDAADYSYLNNPITFRMGPNNRQAFLIGNLIGNNNGNLSGVAVVGDTTFSANIVGLVGSVAGRAARGKISDVYVNTNYIGSSAMYTSAEFNIDNVGTACSSVFSISNTVFTGNKNTCSLYAEYTQNEDTQHTNISISDLSFHGNSKYNITANATYVGTVKLSNQSLYLTQSGDDPNTPIFAEGLTDFDEDTHHLLQLEQLSSNAANLTRNKLYVTGHANRTDRKELVLDVNDYTLTNLYAIINADNAQIASSYTENQYATSDGQVIDLTQAVVKLHVSGAEGTSSYYGSVDLPLSSIFTVNTFKTFGTERFHTSAYDTTQQIKLAPIFNIGGMFGEYVYANGQSIKNSYVKVNARNFREQNSITTSGFKNANCVSIFSPNVVIDSSNKSNCDTFANTFVSADCVVRNKIECYKVGNCAITNSDDCYGTVDYIHYAHLYNQIAPAIVSTQYTFKEHDKGYTYPPILGLQTEDQNFYQIGINMGSDAAIGDDPDAVGSYLMTTANSGIYFNFAGQRIRYNKQSTSDVDKSMWNTRAIDALTAAFLFDSHYGVMNSTVYSTKQTKNMPAYYPLYRGRTSVKYDSTRRKNIASFDVDSYDSRTITVPSASESTLNNSIAQLNTQIEHSHDTTSNPYYVYTNSAKEVYNGAIKPLDLTLTYTPMFARSSMNYAVTANDPAIFNEYVSQMEAAYNVLTYKLGANKAYVASSEYYKHLAVESDFHSDRLYRNENMETVTANVLPFGFIPISADVIRALDLAESATIKCSGLSADDLQYMLVIDEHNNPIFDMSLDITAANNDGYCIEFDSVHHPGLYTYAVPFFPSISAVQIYTTCFGGEAINIENG